MEKKRINWLSILRGLTILLVVMNHVRLLDISTGENYVFIDEIRSWFLPLRIPTFVFVSGALLYYTRITKAYTTLALYKDKIVRIGLPLLFCTCLGNIAQIVFNGFVKHPHDVSLSSFIESFVSYDTTPWPHRWYLAALLLMMFGYPLYVYVLRKKWLTYTVLAALFILMPLNFQQYVDTNWLSFFSLNKHLPFFFLGIATFKYGWWKHLSHSFACPVCWAIYWVLFFIGDISQPFLSVSGIMAMISTCIALDRIVPSLFSSFRNYIFQIYLFGIAFQAFIELIVWRKIGCPTNFVVPIYILNVLTGIYLPVLISKCVEKIPIRWIRLCFGLN